MIEGSMARALDQSSEVVISRGRGTGLVHLVSTTDYAENYIVPAQHISLTGCQSRELRDFLLEAYPVLEPKELAQLDRITRTAFINTETEVCDAKLFQKLYELLSGHDFKL
jgi:uncharacterized protein YcbK (DUF882 family)